MAMTLTMPIIGETVVEGVVERWLKKPGDRVEKFEPIVEINTDKVNVELPSPVSGVVREILAPEGATVAVGGALASIEADAGEQPAEVAPLAPGEAPAPAAVPADGGGERRRATPRVRKLAGDLGVDVGRVAGTGPGGRVLEEDVRAAAGKAASPTSGADEETVALTGIRRTIARRMTASAFSAPHAWLAVEADVTELARLRALLKESSGQRHGDGLTYLPFMVHAVAQALREHPYLNASWVEGSDPDSAHIVLKKRINIGVAVATERGLLVPVIRDADRLSVTGLAEAIHALGERARSGELQLDDVQGGTFTVDNTGVFGSIVSMPVINQGQAAIISLEAVTKRPVVVGEDAIAVRSVTALCLSFDHRILDGDQAGAFLGDVKRRLEAFGPGSGAD